MWSRAIATAGDCWSRRRSASLPPLFNVSCTCTATGSSDRPRTQRTPMQEILLAAWQGLGRFERRASLRTWLYRVATNRCLNMLRAASRRPRMEKPLDADLPEPTRLSEVAWIEPYPDVLLEPERRLGRVRLRGRLRPADGGRSTTRPCRSAAMRAARCSS